MFSSVHCRLATLAQAGCRLGSHAHTEELTADPSQNLCEPCALPEDYVTLQAVPTSVHGGRWKAVAQENRQDHQTYQVWRVVVSRVCCVYAGSAFELHLHADVYLSSY